MATPVSPLTLSSVMSKVEAMPKFDLLRNNCIKFAEDLYKEVCRDD